LPDGASSRRRAAKANNEDTIKRWGSSPHALSGRAALPRWLSRGSCSTRVELPPLHWLQHRRSARYGRAMPYPVCSLCSHPRRAEIDADLLSGMSTVAVARKHGGQQTTFARHLRLHLKPHLHAIAKAAGPLLLPPPTPQAQGAALIPSIGGLLSDLGHTVERLKVLANDAERDGGLGIRAVALRELRSGLADATKLIATLAPPPAPPTEQVDRTALADLFASTDSDSRQAILDRLVP
jgi:hypothetical protein